VGLGLPLHLLVSNDASTGTRESKAYDGLVRRRDFDQFENYLRVVRYVRYGQKRDELYVLAGQHWGSSIGHGTLVNRYNNTLNLDRAKLGLALDVNTIWFGVETLADSLVNPALLASRAYVRPLGDMPILHGWAVGATVAVDRTAPRALATTTSASGQTVLQADEHGAPVVARGEATYAVGIDTEFEGGHNSILSLTPYVDLNRLVGRERPAPGHPRRRAHPRPAGRRRPAGAAGVPQAAGGLPARVLRPAVRPRPLPVRAAHLDARRHRHDLPAQGDGGAGAAPGLCGREARLLRRARLQFRRPGAGGRRPAGLRGRE